MNGSYEQEALMICDEDKYIKILIYDPNTKKFKIEKEYYVHNSFGAYEDLSAMENYCFSNGILYTNSNSYLLQERGTEKNDIEIQVSSRSHCFIGCRRIQAECALLPSVLKQIYTETIECC